MLWILGTFLLFLASSTAAKPKVIEVPVCEPGTNYTLPHFYYCDRYYTCIDGFIHEAQCADGFGYEPYLGCIYSHFIDCTARPYFQPPIANGVCLHLNGIFADEEKGCNYFYECIDGVANSHTCVEGLVFDAVIKKCRKPTPEDTVKCFTPLPEQQLPLVEMFATPEVGSIPAEHTIFDVDGTKFKCPEDALYTFGDHARYPFPGKCRFYIICWKNGKTTVNGCPDKTAFSPSSFTCEPYFTAPPRCDGQF